MKATEPTWCEGCKREHRGPVEHGRAPTYTNHKCRCQPCRDAFAAAMTDYRRRNGARRAPAHVHGTSNGYENYRCRCQPCKDAHAEKGRYYYGKRVRDGV